jgi:uncharacterized protein YdeI (YjbR/CyaY-like superfamily)
MTDKEHGGLPIMAFTDAPSFAAWIEVEPRTSKGVWLKLAKKGFEGLTKPDAIDLALCHGWIDGQQDRYDDTHWLTRFTPRKRASRWSEVNRTRALELSAAGRMQAAGHAEIEAAKADGRWAAAYAPASTAQVPPDLQAALEASPDAATVFATLKGNNRYAILYCIAVVKRPETRARKIAQFVAMLERSEPMHDKARRALGYQKPRSSRIFNYLNEEPIWASAVQ